MAVCEVCFRHCDIGEGALGACKARTCRDGSVVAANYGRVTALALDPIEKKPLARFFPGSKILSYGSYGCNLFCPFCQNYDISRTDGSEFEPDDKITPAELADIAYKFRDRGNIGVAYTYNEPLVSYEFVRDTARLVKEKGMKVNCDLKTRGIIGDVIKLAKSMGVENQLIFTGCVSEDDNKLIDCGEAWFNKIKGIKYKAKNAKALKERIDSYNNPHFKGLNLNYHRVNARFIEACKAVDLKLSVFTVDDIEALLRLVPVIDGNITTNLPLVARSILNKMGNNK